MTSCILCNLETLSPNLVLVGPIQGPASEKDPSTTGRCPVVCASCNELYETYRELQRAVEAALDKSNKPWVELRCSNEQCLSHTHSEYEFEHTVILNRHGEIRDGLQFCDLSQLLCLECDSGAIIAGQGSNKS